MLNFVAYHQDETATRPRHFAVCLIDFIGIVITLFLWNKYGAQPLTILFLLTALIQYAVSINYHWLPENETYRRIDCAMIAITIAMTYVPFWGTKLPPNQALLWLSFVALLTLVILLVFVWYKFLPSLYLVLGLFGLVVSFKELLVWLPKEGLQLFVLGIVNYFLQFIVAKYRSPDPFPTFFGSWGMRHLALVGGITAHTYVVLCYL